MNMNKEMPKSCPFCDEDYASVKVMDVPNDDGFPVAVTCPACGAAGPTVRTTDMDSQEPIVKWNDRPTEDRLTHMVLDAEKRFRR